MRANLSIVSFVWSRRSHIHVLARRRRPRGVTPVRLPDRGRGRPAIHFDIRVANSARIVPPAKLPPLETLFSCCDSSEPRFAASLQGRTPSTDIQDPLTLRIRPHPQIRCPPQAEPSSSAMPFGLLPSHGISESGARARFAFRTPSVATSCGNLQPKDRPDDFSCEGIGSRV
jgi:hypothetical protein